VPYPDGGEQSTDTHLAKKYNDIIYDAIMRCNVSGLVLESNKHYDNLKVYSAAINNLYMNTYFLFGYLHVKYKCGGQVSEGKLAEKLGDLRSEIKEKMDLMKNSPEFRKENYFDEVIELCNNMRMYIMYGLQKLNMLVRTSIREPRGQESIQHWDKKTIFKKGGIKFEAKHQLEKFAN
jgi:hypothetical protein